jgi:hypothetical protein
MRILAATGAAAALIVSVTVRAQDHEHVNGPESSTDPPITVTINPEARVSVTLAGALPLPIVCGTPTELTIRIVNQGFVTSRLEAEFVGNVPAGTLLDFHPEPLTGRPEEQRRLYLTLSSPGPADLTIAFRSHNNSPDLGGRGRIHFLMNCESK